MLKQQVTAKNFYKLIQGDCINVDSFLGTKKVDSVVVDAPYNILKADWDNIKYYKHWLLARIKKCTAVMKSNATLWFWHSNFHFVSRFNVMLEKETPLRLKQFITINKGLQSIAGRTSENLRSFPRATEYLLFYTFEDVTGAQQLASTYVKINPMAKYLQKEFKRARVSNREIAKLFPSRTGGMTGCVSNWLLGLNFPLKVQYEKIREYLNGKRSGEYLRREYEDLRYTFNLETGVTDVWEENFYDLNGYNHPTKKPLDSIKRIVRVATNEGDLVLDPFLGSGTTMEACQHLKRNCVGIEINPKYIKVAKSRCFGRQFLDRQVGYSFEVLASL